MKKQKKFVFPPALLTTINECTQGYFLVTINSNREFEVYQNLNDSIDHMSMIQFLDVHTQVMKDSIMDQAAKQLSQEDAGEQENTGETDA